MTESQPVIGIVDDDVSFREALVDLVDSFGFPAVSFASAHELLASATLPQLLCLIADVQMPDMNGLELQNHLAVSRQSVPLVFVTSYPEAHLKARVLKAGAVGFLGKPFESGDLMRNVLTALNIACPCV